MNNKLLIPILFIISILILGSTILFTKERSQDIYEDEPLEQGSFIFQADENCHLGSAYKFGMGCDQAMFINYDEVAQTYGSSRPQTRVDIKHYVVTDATDLNQLINDQAQQIGGGWGANMRKRIDPVNKMFDTVNAVSLAITDFRKHKYTYIPPYKLELHEDDVELFKESPMDFFRYFGFYFVAGYTTGSSFMASLNYHSNKPEVLAQIERNFYAKFHGNPFKPREGVTYEEVGHTDTGNSTFSSNLTVFGANNHVWNRNDIAESHNIFQDNIIDTQMVSVTVVMYESLPQIQRAITEMTPEKRSELREYQIVKQSFVMQISKAYRTYLFAQHTISEHLIEKGAQLPKEDVDKLQAYKNEIAKRILFIDDIDSFEELQELRLSQDHRIYDYQDYNVEITKYLKDISQRFD